METPESPKGPGEQIATTTNFFTLIMPLLMKGMDLTLTMRMLGDKLVLGVRPNYQGVKDDIIHTIPPIMLTHLPKDLDDSFIETITAPLTKAQALAEALKAWEEKFAGVKAAADKKMEGKPAAEKSSTGSSTPKTKAKPTTKAAPKKTATAPKKAAAPKKSQKDIQAEKNAALLAKIDEIQSTANKLKGDNKHDDAIKEAQKLLRLPSNVGISIKARQDYIQLLKNAKISHHVELISKDYSQLDRTLPEFKKVELPKIKKQLKGLMGINAKHDTLQQLWKRLDEDAAADEKAALQAQIIPLIDQTHALIKGQEFGKAIDVLKKVRSLDPQDTRMKEILEELEKKLGKEFINSTFNKK